MRAEMYGLTARERWHLLREWTEAGEMGKVVSLLETLSAPDVAHCFANLPTETARQLLLSLGPEALEWLRKLPAAQAAVLFSAMPAGNSALLFQRLPAHKKSEILAEMDPRGMEEMLRAMTPEDGAGARQIMAYKPGSAGSIMITDFLSYREEMTVEQVLEDFRTNGERYSDYDVQYAYITSHDGTLRGVLRIRDLLVSSRSRVLSDVMLRNPFHVRLDTPLEELLRVFEERTYVGVPVTDSRARLVGVVRRGMVMEAAAHGTNSAFLKFGGIVGGEELRGAPLYQRCLRRLSYLLPVIFLNLLAATVIAAHQEILQAAIILAVFLPTVSDLSGSSGNQSVAVSIRELSLGLIKPREYLRVIRKESVLGLCNGLFLGGILALISFLWQRDPELSMVVGTALAMNLTISVVLGGIIPLFLKRVGYDPALVSGPILTTLTDICGFFLVLTLAKWYMLG